MKLSEITADDVVSYLRLEGAPCDYDHLHASMAAAKAYISSYTGIPQSGEGETLDDYEDIYLAFMVLCQDAYHYRLWAMEVDGVGAAKVLPLWNGAGTVKVVLASPDMGAVSADIIAAVQSHIEACRPIGADVTVVSAAAKNINVSATVEISADTTLDAVKKELEAAVSEYLQGIAFELSSVSYNKIGYLLLAIPGVNDYSGLKVNNGTSAVTLQTNEVPTLGTVMLSAKSDK